MRFFSISHDAENITAVAHGNIGAGLVEQGKKKEAIPRLEKALKLDPNNVPVKQVLRLRKGI